jgi:zinc protease
MIKEFDVLALMEPLWNEHVERKIFKNGLTVLLKPDHSAKLVTLQAWVKTGSIHEGKFLGSGISHYVEHLLFKGTPTRDVGKIIHDIQSVGGYFNAYTTFDRTVYYVNMPSEGVMMGLDVLADIVLRSNFPEKEVEKERGVIEREIDMCLDDPDYLLGRGLYQAAFREHPYRLPVIGERDLFLRLRREDILEYYTSRYCASNVVLVIVGDVESGEIKKKIGALWGEGEFALPERNVHIPGEPQQVALRELRLIGDYQVGRGLMAWKIPHLSHQDGPALDALVSILGKGESGILWQRIREQMGLVHGISASCWNPGQAGLLSVGYSCDEDKVLEVEKVVREELSRVLSQGIERELLDKVKRRAILAEINNRKTMSHQGGRLGTSEVVIGDLGYHRFYFEQLAKLEPKDLMEVGKRYLQEQTLTCVTLTPKPVVNAKTIVRAHVELSDFEQVTLQNGVRILMQPIENGLPLVHVKVLGLGGVLYEDSNVHGVNALMSTLLTKDTKKRSAKEVAESIENVGGAFSEMAGNNTFGLTLELLPSDLDLGLSLLGEGLLEPLFEKEMFEKELKAQKAGVQEEMDDVVSKGLRELRKRFFEKHPFAFEPTGDLETLSNIDVKVVKDAYGRLIQANNLVVSVSGDFKRDDMVSRLEKVFGRLKSGNFEESKKVHQKPEWLEKDLDRSSDKPHVMRMDREQAVVLAAYPDVGVTSEEHYVSEVLHEIFSGMGSELFKKVREEQSMAYYVGSSRVIGLYYGMFYFYAGTNLVNHEKVSQEIENELKRVADGGVSAEELQRCKTKIIAAKRLSLQVPGTRTLDAGLNALYGLDINLWKGWDKRIEAVTIEDIQEFTKKYLNARHRIKLYVLPKE